MFTIETVVKNGKTYRFLVLHGEGVDITIGYLDRFNNLHLK